MVLNLMLFVRVGRVVGRVSPLSKLFLSRISGYFTAQNFCEKKNEEPGW